MNYKQLKEQIQIMLCIAIKAMFHIEIPPYEINVFRPDSEFGDWSSAIAFRVAKETGWTPNFVAQMIKLYFDQWFVK